MIDHPRPLLFRRGVYGACLDGIVLKTLRWTGLLALAALTLLSGCGPGEASEAMGDAAPSATAFTVTDVAGRQVTLDGPAERVLLGEGRQIIALSLLHPRPADVIAGWLGDLVRLDPETYEQYRQVYPQIDEIPLVGVMGEESFSIEKALAVAPDVAILSGGHGPSEESTNVIRQLEAAGIPVVIIDFSAHPLENTVPSIELLGQVLGREAQAQAYAAFYRARMDRIAERLEAAAPERPSVLMHMHAGAWECCRSPGAGNLGELITFAGGRNIGADVIPGALGVLNLEYIIAQDPDVYVGTGVPGRRAEGGVELGTGVPAAEARGSLREVVQQPGLAEMAAVRDGRVYGLWHNFYTSPVNVLAAEAMARWFHPELFADVDPAATLQEMNERFLAVPLEGTFWTSQE